MKKLCLILAAILCLACVPASALTMSAPGELPLVDETQTLTILITDNVYITDYEDNYFTQMIEEACNVNLEFVFLPSADSFTKLNVMISSGETLPDVICYGLGLADVYNFAQAGALVPIDELIEKYSANFTAICDKYPELLIREKITAADGHIYGLPQVFFASADSIWQNCWINGEWLEAVGKEVPTTTDELYEVLVAFRDEDPNGNGLADEIPLTGAISGWSKNVLSFLMNSFCYNNATDYLNVKDGEVFPVYATEEWKEGVLFIKKLLDEGLLDAQCFTQTSDQMMALVMTEDINTVGCFMNMSPRKADIYVNLPPVIGPYGFGYTAYSPASVGSRWFITSDCKNPELAYRVGDYMFNEDQSFNLSYRYGEEGVYWNYAAGNEAIKPWLDLNAELFYLTKDETTGEVTNAWNQQNNEHWRRENPGFYYKWDDNIGYNANDFDETSQSFLNSKLQYDTVSALTASSLPPVDAYIPFIAYNLEETETYNAIRPDLYTYVDESFAAFLTGTRDIEAEWDTYLAQLEALRVDDFIATVQAAYDRIYN